jgi:N12 class adenine-specific DNA methylase
MYTIQRFLDPEGMLSRGIEHFDSWAATFGEVG